VSSLSLNQVIFPICADIEYFEISRRFGVQTKFADRAFLGKALNFSDVVYSIHLENPKVYKFISNYIKKFGWKIDNVLPFTMVLERTFPFHTQKTKRIKVWVYRFVRK
jgi:predicted RNA methylase